MCKIDTIDFYIAKKGVGMLKKLIVTAALICASSPAYAWDSSGKITSIHVVTNGDNFGFRVYQDGPPICGTSEHWGFINKGDSNYDAMVALLMSAYMNGKPVTLLTNQEGQYCHITYAML